MAPSKYILHLRMNEKPLFHSYERHIRKKERQRMFHLMMMARHDDAENREEQAAEVVIVTQTKSEHGGCCCSWLHTIALCEKECGFEKNESEHRHHWQASSCISQVVYWASSVKQPHHQESERKFCSNIDLESLILGKAAVAAAEKCRR